METKWNGFNTSWDSAATLYAKGIIQWQSNKMLNKGRSESKKSDVFWLWLWSRNVTCLEQKLRVAFLLHDEWFLDERMIYMWMGLNGPKTHPGPAIRSICDPLPVLAGIKCAIYRSDLIGASHRTLDFEGLVGSVRDRNSAIRRPYRMTRFFGSPATKEPTVVIISIKRKRAANDFHYEF